MAITDLQVAQAIGLTDGTTELGEPELGIVRRKRIVAKGLVEEYAPTAPDDFKDEAVILIVGYIFDMPPSPRGDGYAASFRNCGAQSILGPWHVQKAYVVEV